MQILRCSSDAKNVRELLKLAEGIGNLLFLSPSAVRTEKELQAAFYLASEAFKSKKNISEKLANEAMLFLSCETNFSSAAKKIGAASPDDFILVSKETIPIAKLKRALRLASAESLSLSEWGKKRGAYFEGEIAVEKMALSRIMN